MEKLLAEEVALQYARDFPTLQVRIARFHNVFGPQGTWRGGREKAPAALCRKVAVVQQLVASGQLPEAEAAIELWGDGAQTRSFCFVSDAVDGVLRLMQCNDAAAHAPLNIGSDRGVSMQELLALVQRTAGTNFPVKHVDGPQGVRGRNSDNALLKATLAGWQPKVTLEDGILRTFEWISAEIERVHAGGTSIRQYASSNIVELSIGSMDEVQ
jgi:nucleoside-diphosphate-sugar epimerase